MMMDHSRADTKSMSKMKDRTIRIHNPCDPVVNAGASVAPVDHMMMDHSRADTKSMSKMKDKKIPIHHSGDAEKPSVENPPK